MANGTNTAARVRQLFDAKAAAWPSKYSSEGRLAGRLTRLTGVVSHHVPVEGAGFESFFGDSLDSIDCVFPSGPETVGPAIAAEATIAAATAAAKPTTGV